MSFEGIQFLQKIFSGQAIIQQRIQFIVQFVVGRVYYEYIILMLPCGYLIMNTVPISFIFIHKIPNADQCATRKLCIR